MPIQPPVIARETAYALGDHLRVTTGSGSGSAVYENRLYRCVVAGTTAADEPVYDTTVGEQTTDGSAVFEPIEAWSRAGIVVNVIDRASLTASIDELRAVDDWFTGGVLTWETGSNAGRAIEVNRRALDHERQALFPAGTGEGSGADTPGAVRVLLERLKMVLARYRLEARRERKSSLLVRLEGSGGRCVEQLRALVVDR